MQREIGELKERVTLQRQTLTPDALGGNAASWSDVATVWASVTPVSSSTAIRANAAGVAISHKIIMRWRSEFNLDGYRYRLMWRGKALHISGDFNPDADRRFVEITAMAGDNIAS